MGLDGLKAAKQRNCCREGAQVGYLKGDEIFNEAV